MIPPYLSDIDLDKGDILKSLIKKIYKKIRKLFSRENNTSAQQHYYDNDTKNLRFSSIYLDMRKPLKNKKYVRIGNDCSVSGTIIFETPEGFVEIADRVFIGGVTIICRNSILIEENVQIAWGVTIFDHNAHSFDYKERIKDIDLFFENKKKNKNVLENKNWDVVKASPIRICKNAWIGMNTIILNGVTIGEGAIIGAGSVVRSDIPPWTIAMGNPALVIADNKFKPTDQENDR